MKVFVFLFCIILLAGCGTMDNLQPGEDLGKAIADARATQVAAKAAMLSTQKAAERERLEATVQAAKTAGAAQAEIDLLVAKSQATQDALDADIQRAQATEVGLLAQATQTRVAEQATGTKAIEQIRATSDMLMAVASQTAVVADVKRAEDLAERREIFDRFWVYFWPAFGVTLLIVAVFLVIYIIHLLLDWWITLVNRRNRHHSTPRGILVYNPDGNGGETPQLMTGERHYPTAYQPEVKALTASGSVLSSAMPERGPGSNHSTAITCPDVCENRSQMLSPRPPSSAAPSI